VGYEMKINEENLTNFELPSIERAGKNPATSTDTF
jgi:hypothetical protein